MKKVVIAITILAVASTTALAFPTGHFTNKGGDVTIKKDGNSYAISANASDENAHSCAIDGTLPETSPGVLSGMIDDKPVTVKMSKGKLVLKAKDAEICGIGITISGTYKKK